MMTMWRTIIIAAGVLGVLMFLYTVLRARRLGFIKRIAEDHPVLAWLLAIAVPGLFVFPFLVVSVFAAVVALLHLAFIWMICDFIAFIVLKARGVQREKYLAGYVAMIITVGVLVVAWNNAHDVRRTAYSFQT